MANSEPLDVQQKSWRWRIFALTWLAYAGYYLCRKNLSVTMPLMSAEQHYTKLQLANIIFGYSLLYAVGQFLFGVLADKFGSRRVVTLGLLTAVLSNFLLGFSSSVTMLTVFACLNGAGQSAGWPGLVKNMAAWFRHQERGVVMAWWTTNYVVGGFAGTLFATFVVTSTWLFPELGWRRGFWLPAFALLFITVLFFLLVRNRPSEAGLAVIVENDGDLAGHKENSNSEGSFGRTVTTYFRMLGDWEVWVVAIGALFSKVTRYSFMFWLPLYLAEQLKYSTREAGNTSSLFELAGFGGALLGGYVSDKFMHSRRLPVAAMMMWGLGLACWLHPTLAGWGRLGVALSICLIGVMNYGPDTLLQGAASQDVGAKWGVGTASGFVDGISSVGQMFSAYLVAYVAAHYGWNRLFYVFVALAFIGGCIMATRWRNLSTQKQAQLDLEKVVTTKPASNLLP
jgi:OPA family sugar phosphate sensor protein UhpC-like MFS transporter